MWAILIDMMLTPSSCPQYWLDFTLLYFTLLYAYNSVARPLHLEPVQRAFAPLTGPQAGVCDRRFTDTSPNREQSGVRARRALTPSHSSGAPGPLTPGTGSA